MSDENENDLSIFQSFDVRGMEAMQKAGERAAYVPVDDTDDDVRAAIAEVGNSSADREDFERSRENREELAWRYPDSNVGDLVKRFAGLHDDFKRDPFQAADHLARHYLAQPARFTKPKAREAEQPPSYLDESGRLEWQRDQDARDAFRTAGRDRVENEAFKATAEDRAFLKKAFPQLTFAQAIERITTLDAELTADPLGASAKLAATFGAPVTQGHHLELQNAGQRQQDVIRMQDGLERVISSGKLPGIENMMDVVADVLESGEFNRSGEIGADLEAAYKIALGRVTRQREQSIADNAKRASGINPETQNKQSAPAENARRDRFEQEAYADDVDLDAREAFRKSAA